MRRIFTLLFAVMAVLALASCADEDVVYVPDKSGIVVDERSHVYQDKWKKEFEDELNGEVDHAREEQDSMTGKPGINLPVV